MISKFVPFFSLLIMFGLAIETQQIMAAAEPITTPITSPTIRMTGTEPIEEQNIPKIMLKGHKGLINSASLSPNGRLLVTASDDNTAIIWDTETWQPIFFLKGHEDRVNAAAFSPRGDHVITSSNDTTARIWDAYTGECIHLLSNHKGRVISAEFSPDGQRLLTVSGDGNTRIWNVLTGNLIETLEGAGDDLLEAATFSPHGIATVDSFGVAELVGISRKYIFENHTVSIAFSTDGQRAATACADYKARLWQVNMNRCVRTLHGHEDRINSASFRLDGSRLVTASDDKTAIIWDVYSGNPTCCLLGHNAAVKSAAFINDGQGVLTMSDDNTVRFWDANTGDCTCILEFDRINYELEKALRQVEDSELLPKGYALAAREAMSSKNFSRQDALLQEANTIIHSNLSHSNAEQQPSSAAQSAASSTSSTTASQSDQPTMQPERQIYCHLCLENKNESAFVRLSCANHHAYCKECLYDMLNVAVRENVQLQCPEPTCRAKFTIQDIYLITNDRTIRDTLDQREFEEWVRQNAKFCPTPGCQVVFQDEGNDRNTIQCPQCHQSYCSSCCANHRLNISCEEAKAMRQMPNDPEIANEQWLMNNTKQCPRCHTQIEKNEGCLHMTCRNGRCRHQFCWNCLEPWPCPNSRGNYVCNAVAREQMPMPIPMQLPWWTRNRLYRFFFR